MSRIAFVSKRDGNWEIYVMNADGSGKSNLTNHPGFDSHPTWSPDGSKIAFYSDRDGDNNIYVMNSDGSNQVQLTSDPASDLTPAWSPDGTKIAFVSDRGGSTSIWIMNPDGSEPTNITPFRKRARWPAWSPDSSQVAFVVESSLFAFDREGIIGTTPIFSAKDKKVLFDGFFLGWPDWSPSGSELALISNLLDRTSLDVGTLYTVEADGDAFRPLIQEAVGPDEKPSWSPDGRKIAYASFAGSGQRDIWVVDVAAKSTIRLTEHEATDAFPAWEPTGFVPNGPPPSPP